MNTNPDCSRATLRKILAELLGEPPVLRHGIHAADSDVMVEVAAAEGVTTLVYRALGQLGVDRHLLASFRSAAISQAGAALMLRRERDRALGALSATCPVLLKGEVLARTVYPEYPDRPMGDMDILVHGDRFEAVDTRLRELGYSPQPANRASLVMPQQSYRLKLSGSVFSIIDVHTALFNRPALQGVLDYTRIREAGAQGPGLPTGITVPCPAHLLIHAALHLLGHHGGDPRLIWLLDIQLLLRQLESAQAEILLRCMREHGLSAAMVRAMDTALPLFPLEDVTIVERIRSDARRDGNGALDPETLTDSSPLGQALHDLRALDGAGQRLTWLRQHLFPRAEYMKSHYSLRRTWLLPLFYLWRILRGGVKLLRPR